MDRFIVKCDLAHGWHVLDLHSKLVVEEFGQYQNEAADFCVLMNRMWREFTRELVH